MVLPVPPNNPNRPIPNNPFYSPESFALQGTVGPIVVGSGLNVDYATNTLSSTGGGGGAVAQVTGGTGISVSPTTGNVVVTNTGVTSLAAGAGISLSGSSGAVTITATGGGGAGTVTNVATGAGLTGGPITTTGTIALATTAVTPASYTNANITVDSYGRITAASNGTVSGGTVTSVGTGTGLTGGTITTTGTIALANTSVTPGSYTYASFTVDQQGRLTGASSNTPCSGTVTSVATGTGLTGGPITTTGTVALADTAVTPGNYTNASFTVDQQGRLTAASTGVTPVTAVSGSAPISVSAGGTPNVSIASASTSALGAVQLTNALNNTSETLALTACAGACLQSQITALATTPGIEFAGTIDASTGLVASVTSVGTGAGYTVGSVLPAASATTVNTYVIVTTPGTMTPPGGSSTVAGDGDWFLVSQTSPGVYAWQFLNVGFDAPPATTSVAGVVCLSTNALAQAGTDTTTALTPAAAASAFIPNSTVTGKGVVLTGTGAGAPSALPAGTDGCALIACAACPCGLTWGAAGGIAATPTVAGVVLGCTDATRSALGCNALAAANATTCNVGVGTCAAASVVTGVRNVAVGACALQATTGSNNSALGAAALQVNVGGSSNIAVGFSAGCNLTSGDRNVAIGPNTTFASATGACQLVIGFCTGCNWLTGDSTKAIRPGAGIIDCAGSCGTAGQVLMSNGSNAICWGTIGNATPTVAGIVLGCTTATNTYLGCSAGVSTTAGSSNVAIGHKALCSNTTFASNTAVGTSALEKFNGGVNAANDAFGMYALCGLTSGEYNVAVGGWSFFQATSGCRNTGIGHRALNGLTSACDNTALGFYAGCNITTGCCNVAIGPYTSVANPAGSCQLAIGWCQTCNWLTGDSSKNIRPGAGIIDCTGSVGGICEYLVSTGTALKWITPPSTNYRQCVATSTTTPVNALCQVAGFSITTSGNPLQINAYGDAYSSGNNWYGQIFIRRCGTPNVDFRPTWVESSSGSINETFALSYIDTPAAGSYCYALMVCVPSGSGGNIITGENGGPVLNGVELGTVAPGMAPPWINAGTIQSVGLGATVTAPTIGTTNINNVRYRQLGPKEWEVQGVLRQTAAGGSGNGYYLFTLPGGLQFDTTSPYQVPYTGVPDNNQGWYFSSLINSWTMIANTGSSTYGRASITPYDATRYRISGNADYGVPNYISNSWYQLGTGQLWWKWGFTFRTP